MSALVSTVLSWLTGGGLSGLASEIRQARKDVLDAENDEQRLKSKERLGTLLVRKDAQTQGQANWLPKVVRAVLFALPIGIYLWKLIVWDKILGWGVTDPLGEFEKNVASVVVAFYFLTSFTQR